MYRFQTGQESQDEERQKRAVSFWRFSLEMWRHASVQNGVLTLQDEFGANINTLLFASWLALEGRKFDPNSVAQSGLSDWNATMTAPLRALRRQAKRASVELYQCLKSAELAAERHEQRLLVSIYTNHPVRDEQATESREARLRANLVSYLRTLGSQNKDPALSFCQALLQQALSYSPSTTQEPDSP